MKIVKGIGFGVASRHHPRCEGTAGEGAAPGTVLGFMMAVIGLSLPGTIILCKVLKVPLIAAFSGIVALGILAAREDPPDEETSPGRSPWLDLST